MFNISNYTVGIKIKIKNEVLKSYNVDQKFTNKHRGLKAGSHFLIPPGKFRCKPRTVISKTRRLNLRNNLKRLNKRVEKKFKAPFKHTNAAS